MKTRTKIAIGTAIVAIGGASLAGVGMARGGFGHGGGHHGGHWGGGPFGGGRAMMLMEQFDADQDGRLTRAEIDEAIGVRLANADSDGDGNLNLDEFQPLLVEIMRPKIVDGFQFLDDDGDAVITREEIDRPLNRIVSRLDRNGDGELTADEMQRHHRAGKHGHDRGYRDDDDDDAS